MFRRPLGKEVGKRRIFRPPGTVKMRLPLKRELNFHFSQGSPIYTQNEAKIEPTWVPKVRRRPEVVPRIGRKREPKWDPKIAKNHEKSVSKNKVDHRRFPGPPQGRYWSHFGTHFCDFLVYFNVSPRVFNAFHMKIDVFPCVYDDLTLHF